MLNINEKLLDQLDESQYFLISKLMKYGKRSCPKNDVLANATGWGINKVQKIKKQLVELGFLSVKPRYKIKGNKRVKDSNEYKITTNLIAKFRGEEIEKKPIEKVVFHLNDFHVDEFEVDDFHVDEFEVDENGAVIKVLRILSIENKELLRFLKEKNNKKEKSENPIPLESQTESSEERKKVAPKKEKHEFPNNSSQKKYDVRDKRHDKNLPFDVVSATNTLKEVYPTGQLLCDEMRNIYGLSIRQAEANERIRDFCTVGITNYARNKDIRSIDVLIQRCLNWVSTGIKNGYSMNKQNNQSNLDKYGLPILQLKRKKR